MSDSRRRALLVGGIPLGIMLLLCASWGIDTAVSGDRVIRNVEVAGIPLGGLNRSEVVEIASDLTADLANTPLALTIGDAQIPSNPVELGAMVDGDALADSALAARRGGFFLLRPFRWLGTLFSEEQLDVPYSVDKAASSAAVDTLVTARLTDPIEPSIELTGGRVQFTPGADGATIPADSLNAPLLETLQSGPPYSVALEPVPLHPDTETSVLEAVADEANEATSAAITVQVLDDTTTISSATLRSWVRLTDTSPPDWEFDPSLVMAELQAAFPELGTEEEKAQFNVVDGTPVIIPPSSSIICCQEVAVGILQQAAKEGVTAPVVLHPETAGGDEAVEALEALGIIEEVSTFTTKHSCCQNRVKNIQKMADIVRGHVVMPGDTFSLNEVVGKRTREGGFLPAGAIADGVLEDQVGGGVSQFTTTIFNAVFFAGLEFNEYQSHSLYFSRYPYGREATISWPLPNFIFTNNTEYGVLIWPTYTDTSITVTFYSTRHIAVEDLGHTTSSQGSCTRVTTTRERTYDDGSVEKDTVFAVYRPGAGLDCAGNPTKAAPTTTTTEGDGTSSTSEGDGSSTTTTEGGGGDTTTTTVADTTTTTADTTTTTADTTTTTEGG